MKSRPATLPIDGKISIKGHVHGLSGSVLWDTAILCDYFAHQLLYISEAAFGEDKDEDLTLSPGADGALREMIALAEALKPTKGKPLTELLDVKGGGLTGFVQWEKSEIFNHLMEELMRWGHEFSQQPATIRKVLGELESISDAIMLAIDYDRAMALMKESERAEGASVRAQVRETKAA